jgi:hypothetical protein
VKPPVIAGECGQPGRLYPETAADRAGLGAGLESDAFWKAAMIARCARHAPPEPPAACFDGQVEPCSWLPEPDATCTICSGPLDQALIKAGFTDHGEAA